jgi:hypothetical protein
MGIDLFGNSIQQKALTATQHMSTRQTPLTGRDLYTTDPGDIGRFLKAIRRDGVELRGPVWEPAAGMGDISKELMRHGYEVRSSDIFPYRDNEIDVEARDFLASRDCGGRKTVFTNPPFNAHVRFLEHALSLNIDAVFFVRLSFLSSIRRYRIYEKYNPAYIYVYSKRAHCYKNGDHSKGQNMVDYCVIMWKPPYKNETVLRWIA